VSITTMIHDEMHGAMEDHYNARSKIEPYNRTIEGLIKTVLGNNQYTVTMNMIDYTIPGTVMPASSYIAGNIVLIEVPNQNFSQKYIKCQKPY